MELRTAIVFGATGMVGNILLEELINSADYSVIKIFVREPTGISEPKVQEIITDVSDPASYSAEITGDDIFICLGTTIKKAGSVANMEKIDRDLPVQIAGLARKNGIKNIAVVSSIGAAKTSRNYYLRIKGEMETGILKLDFDNTVIVRPSMLLGERKERRRGEMVGKVVMKTFQPVLIGKLLKYRAIHAGDVARAMILIMQKKREKNIFESDELQKIAREY
jgi:uncharacterized protein YbjT (DUF2867 family)